MTHYTVPQAAALLGYNPVYLRRRVAQLGLGRLLNASTRLLGDQDIETLRASGYYGARGQGGETMQIEISAPVSEWADRAHNGLEERLEGDARRAYRRATGSRRQVSLARLTQTRTGAGYAVAEAQLVGVPDAHGNQPVLARVTVDIR